MIDTKKLSENADAREIVKSLFSQNDYKQAGATLFVRCPGGHKETQINHCAVYKNGCKCFSCGESFSTIEMVKRYFPGDDFVTVCEKIADISGYDISWYRSSKTKEKKFLLLSAEELETVGIYQPKNPDYPSFEDYMREDKENALLYLKERTREYMEKYNTMIPKEQNICLKEALKARYNTCRKILQKLGDKRQYVPKLFDI